MQLIEIPVPDGPLCALRSGEGTHTVLAAHGLTASGMSFRTVARYLPPDWRMVAVDLRGRGGSTGLPGPYGMDRHAADLAAVAEYLGTPLVLVGQSMGAYAALRAATTRPELFERLVLVDGGLPLPVPPGVDPDQFIAATVGPAIARLSQTYPSEQAYLDVFQTHPALSGAWNEDLTEYVRYDTAGGPGAIRSRTNPDAVAVDGRDLVVHGASFGDDLVKLALPTLLLYAPRGMLGQEPGLLPQPLVDHWAALAPALRVELVPDTNHYTILMTDRPAELIARRLVGHRPCRKD
jgi:pimeloyl-ACP methyl ester carboxylesterase